MENIAQKDKMVVAPPNAKATPPLREYHFPGSGEWIPQTIKAASLEEATIKWQSVRRRVDAPAEPAPQTTDQTSNSKTK